MRVKGIRKVYGVKDKKVENVMVNLRTKERVRVKKPLGYLLLNSYSSASASRNNIMDSLAFPYNEMLTKRPKKRRMEIAIKYRRRKEDSSAYSPYVSVFNDHFIVSVVSEILVMIYN